MDSGAPPRIFDLARRRAVRHRACCLAVKPDAARFMLDDMVDDVVERLAFMRSEPVRSLIIGDTGNTLSANLSGQIITADPADFDEEGPLPFEPFDFIASLGSLDTVNDLPGALIHLRNALAPGGVLIASFPGLGCLPALRKAMLAADGDRPAARLHPMVDRRSGAALMQRCGFARQVVDSRRLQVRYGSFDQLIADLRAQALTNVLTSRPPPLSRKALEVARRTFMAEADRDGRVTEHFEIITLTGWKN